MDDISSYKKAYEKGENIISLMKEKCKENNSSTAIETSYDIQAGAYIESAKNKEGFMHDFTLCQYDFYKKYVSNSKTILDVGCGELTNLVKFVSHMNKIVDIYAFDISWSRLFKGICFAKSELSKKQIDQVNVFCSDIKEIPLPDNSIDVVLSCHALEPNHGYEECLLEELGRVAKEYVILFEPCFEKASKEAQQRMIKHGYVRGLPDIAENIGFEVVEQSLLPVTPNPLNPTAALVLKKQTRDRLPLLVQRRF